MNDVELKPCPFCGSTARIWGAVERRVPTFYTVECNNEECGCVYGDNLQLDLEEVVEAWNKRAGGE